MQGSDKRDYLWLCAILALAAALRIWGLNAPLWFDEMQTIIGHLRLDWGDMVHGYSMNNHYLHNLAAKSSISVFGEQPWAIRLPAMLFGVGTVAATWFLARYVANAAVAHSTSLLLALSYHEIWFSQNARGYTGLAFFSTIAMLLFLRGMKEPRRAIWIGYGICLAAAVFTHLTGAFFFVAQGLVWLSVVIVHGLRGRLEGPVFRLPLMGFVLGGVIALVLYLPLLPSLITTVSTVSETSAVDVMQEYQNPIWTAFEAVRTGVGQAGPLVTLIGSAIVILSILGAIALHRDAPLFAPVAYLHIILTALLLVAVGMRVWPRFFFVDVGLLMLLIVAGVRLSCGIVAHFLGGERVSRILFIVAVIAMVAISAVLAKRNYEFPKQNLIGAYDLVLSLQKPGDRVYTISYAGEVYEEYFGEDWPILYTETEYSAAMAEPGPVILIVGFPERSRRSVPSLDEDKTTILTEVAHFRGTLGDGDIFVYRRD